MRVSLLNLNLVAKDAIGRYIMDKARYFRARGDEVRIYVQHVSDDIPQDIQPILFPCTLGQLIGNQPEYASLRDHFFASDLCIYDYPNWYELIESIRGVDRGTVIFDYHGVTPPELWGVNDALDMLTRSVDELPHLLRYADYAIGHSTFTHDEMVERYHFDPDKAFEFPYAVPLDDFTPRDPEPALVRQYGLEDKGVLLYVGRMAGNKRVDLLIKALPIVHQEHPETVLLLVGDNASPVFKPIVADLQDLVDELGLKDSVIFTGMVEDLPAYYRLADIYVTSSLHEGFCVPLVESMAMGLPMVGTSATAIPYTMGDAGLTFEPEDVADLAANVIHLLDDPELTEELRQKGFQRASLFSQEALVEHWDELLERALAYQPALTEAPPVAQEPPSEAMDTSAPAELAPIKPVAGMPQLPDLEGHFRELETAGDVSHRDYAVRSGAPIVGSLIAWVRRNLTSHLKEPYLDPIIDRQVHMNRRLVWDIRDVYNRLREVATSLGHSLEARITDLGIGHDQLTGRVGMLEEAQAQLDSGQEPLRSLQEQLATDQSGLREVQEDLIAQIGSLVEETKALGNISAAEARRSDDDKARAARDTRLWGQFEGLRTDSKDLSARQDLLAQRVHELCELVGERPEALERDIDQLRTALNGLSPEVGAQIEALSAALTQPGQLDSRFNYFLHADTVGGAASVQRRIYSPLVERFRDAPDVVDLGCGSGVFLQLLREAGIAGYGIDLDEDSILLCRKKGLEVRQEDIIAHLRSLPDKSLGGIFAAHVIEHLPVQTVWEFLQLCYQKMLYGASLVLVTPNGAALSIFYYTFYKDLTHIKPLHPEALRFLLETNGFRRAELSFISPMPEELKLLPLDANLASDEIQRQWAQVMNRNLERINALLFGELDCVASSVK